MRKRIGLIVYVDLDPVPGIFGSEDSALVVVQEILDARINHYNPIVSAAPSSLQPNHPSFTGEPTEAEVRLFQGNGGEFPLAGANPYGHAPTDVVPEIRE